MERDFAMNFRRLCLLLGLIGSTTLTSYSQSSLLTESVTRGSATPAPLTLGLRDAIDRGLKNNLASIVSSENERAAAAQRLGDLAELHPRMDIRFSSEVEQRNLAAFGFSGFPGVNQIIGPFGLVDARAAFTAPLVDRERTHNLRESTAKERAAAFSYQNTRELVVLTVVDLYFQALSSESRIAGVQAQLERARALHDRATDLKNAGLATGLDVVRAEVEQRSVEQRLIQSKNTVQKQKLMLARAIGLPLAQQFTLSDSLPPETETDPPMNQLLELALGNRADAKALDAEVHAAEEALKAQQARNRPTISAHGDYGVIGPSLSNSHGTFTLGMELRVPLFDKSIESGTSEKIAKLRERTAERDSLQGRIELEVRSALLDLQTAREELQISRRRFSLAQQQLDQSQDRFAAGVTDNLEVVQAQEAVALANEVVIQSLYDFNISRALLAKSTGVAERSIADIFRGSSSK
jgi:outer membrane protein TolC